MTVYMEETPELERTLPKIGGGGGGGGVQQRRRKVGLSKKITGRLLVDDSAESLSSGGSGSLQSPVEKKVQNDSTILSGHRHFSISGPPLTDKFEMPLDQFDTHLDKFATTLDKFETTSNVFEINRPESDRRMAGGIYFDNVPSMNSENRHHMKLDDEMSTSSKANHLHRSSSSTLINSQAQDNRSFDSTVTMSKTSSLQRIPIHEARGKTFLLGNVGRKELVNSDELDKLFPQRSVIVCICSWNLAGKEIPIDALRDWILSDAYPHTADIYAIGIQEAPTNSGDFTEWEAKLQQCLLSCKQVLFHSVWLGVQHLAIFIRRELIWFMSRVDDFRLSTRAISNVRTKGALAIAFKLFGSSFLFISSHLAYGADPAVRVRDYTKIVRALYLKNFLLSAEDVIRKIHHVFWFGDLNFRLEEKRNVIETFVQSLTPAKSFSVGALLTNDQLIRERTEDRVFGGFSETEIRFLPTYKYDIGTNNFDTSAKNRVPAYTDRILFRNNTNDEFAIRNLVYSDVWHLCFSDHKPVFGVFSVALRPGRDNLPAPKFNTKVYQKGVENAAKSTTGRKSGRTQSAVCSVM